MPNILISRPWGQSIKPPIGQPIDYAHPLMLGLVEWWQLNVGGGTTVYDSISAQTGSFVGNAAWLVGSGGMAVDFDGSTDKIDVPELGSSLAHWSLFSCASFDTSSGVNQVYSADAGGWNDDLQIGIYPEGGAHSTSGRFAAIHQDGTSSVRTVVEDIGTIETGVVHNFCVTSDGATFRLFKNGLLVASAAKAGTALTHGTTARYLAGHDSQSARSLDGQLYDSRLYNYCLPESLAIALTANPYQMFQVQRIWSYTTVGGTSYDESITLSSTAAGPISAAVDWGASITLAAQAAQGDGTIATFNPLASLAASVGQTEAATATIAAIATLTSAVGTTWAEIVTKEGLLTLAATVANPTTTLVTYNALAQLTAVLASPITGTNTLSASTTLSSSVGVTWTDTLGEFIETLTMAVSAGMTPTEQTDLVASLALAMNAALTEQYTASVNALVSLGVSVAQAETAGLALVEAVTMGIQASLTNAGTVSSAAIGNLLKVISEQIATPTVASEGLAISTHGESIDT